jgi:hypothetical protein
MMEIERQTLLLHGNIGIKDAALLWGIDDDDSIIVPMWNIFDAERRYDFRGQWNTFIYRGGRDNKGNMIETNLAEYRPLESKVYEAWKVARDVFKVLNSKGHGTVSLEELKRLAEIRGERPKFLFPKPVATTTPQSSELDPRAESTIYTLLAVLLKAQGYSLDDKSRVGKVKRLIELEGAKMSDRAIRDHIKKAFETLESKRK